MLVRQAPRRFQALCLHMAPPTRIILCRLSTARGYRVCSGSGGPPHGKRACRIGSILTWPALKQKGDEHRVANPVAVAAAATRTNKAPAALARSSHMACSREGIHTPATSAGVNSH